MKEVLDVPDLRGKMCTAIYSATVKIRFLVRICMDAIREKETLRRLLNERNAMRTKTFILALFAVVGAYSCRVAEETPFAEETIPFNSYGQVPCESPNVLFPDRIKRVVLDPGGSKDYIFSEIDKIVCHQDRFYILDWIHRKIVIYDSGGAPVGCLSRRGRGPGEYLQITDFDVDGDGSVWVVDGQQDMLLLREQMDQRLKDMQGAEHRMQDLIREARALEDKKMRSLILMYSNMKPKIAAKALENMDDRIAIRILSGMPPKQAGEILTYTNPEKTAEFSELISRMKSAE